MTTKFSMGIVFRKAQVSAKFHCPISTVTLFSEDGEGGIHSSPVIESPKRPANTGATIVYNYPCYVRRRGWMPKGLLSFSQILTIFITLHLETRRFKLECRAPLVQSGLSTQLNSRALPAASTFVILHSKNCRIHCSIYLFV